MDSMAIYRRMDIGTAKPTVEDRHRIPHHLVDVIDPCEEFSLARYLEEAHKAAEAIRSRNRRVLFVGGTPLYLKALVRGADGGPPPDPEFRARLEQEAEMTGTETLYCRLAAVDPAAARRMHANDRRRIIRALEVFEKTGQPISNSQVHFHSRPNQVTRIICLDLPRGTLYERINDRVLAMFRMGLVDEVRGLLQLDRSWSRTARQALGYKEVIEHLNGKRELVETIELVQRRSRQFAKRQLTWFRSIEECQWVTAGPELDFQKLMGMADR
jgi:tRNA dimethylallyltransferase